MWANNRFVATDAGGTQAEIKLMYKYKNESINSENIQEIYVKDELDQCLLQMNESNMIRY